MHQDNRTAPTMPAQAEGEEHERDWLDHMRSAAQGIIEHATHARDHEHVSAAASAAPEGRDEIELPDFTSDAPPIHYAPSHAQLLMQVTLPPVPMVGGFGELLALAGGAALDAGQAMSSERCSRTEYHGGSSVEDLSKSDTDQVPAFHFESIASMSDAEVEAELFALLNNEQAKVERRIMLYLARRYFTLGLASYGPVRLFDGRDNQKEMREEAADFLFYFGKEQLEQEVR